MRLPVGESDFEEVINGKFYFVDKSLFIKEIINDNKVILITRPRRFGKTLNLSMLHYFFAAEVEGQSTSPLFDHLAISKEQDICTEHQGKHPVLSFSFKDIKKDSYEQACAGISKIISRLYDQHRYLLDSDSIAPEHKAAYQSILAQTATETDLLNSLLDLTTWLHRHHGSKVVVLIDEYDTPIQSGYLHGYYTKIVDFFRSFFGAGLKDNKHIFKAVLTGILRIAKENLFSGLNNLVTYSMLNENYGAYFGFTEHEVVNLIRQAKLEEKFDEVKNWYNGYLVGGHATLYNPWSIANYIKKRKLQTYWVNTSDNALIKKLMIKSSLRFKQQLETLLQNQPLEKIIDPDIVFADLDESEGAVWSLLLMSGYLKPVTSEHTDQGFSCQLEIPNMEVRNLYRQIIEQWLSDGKGVDWYNEFLQALLTGDIQTFSEHLRDIMLQTISYHDVSRQPEAFYQGLMIGLTASLDKNKYQLKSNKEGGNGRYDIIIMPRELQQLGVVLELKSVKPVADGNQLTQQLEQQAQRALQQINNKNYDSEFRQQGLQQWLKIGLAFSGKYFSIAEERFP